MSATRRTAVLHLALSIVLAGMTAHAEERRPSSTAPQAARVDLRPAFEENRGQADPRVRFVSKSPRQTLFLTADEAVLALRSSNGPAALRLRLRDANDRAEMRGLEPLPAKTYYASPETRGPLPPVSMYQRVRYADVYPGIDLEYYRTNEHLEFDFTVAPYTAADRIEFSLAGADTISRTVNGELRLRVGGEDIVLWRPIAFQVHDGVRQEVSADYDIAGTNIRFELGAYDPSLPLVIDPMIVYATYLGGTGDDYVIGADVNEAGELYLFGRTNRGVGFPHTQVEPAQRTIDPINCFVSKISADGTTLQYSVIFEGFGICEAFELDGERVHVGMQAQLGNYNGFAQLRTLTDNGGTVAVAGLRGGPFEQIPGNATQIEDIRSDQFGNTYVLYHQLVGGAIQGGLLKLDASGTLIGTFEVGVPPDSSPTVRAMAVDNFGQVFIVGKTIYDIAPSPDAFQPTKPPISTCPENGFLIRVNTNTLPFQQTYATYIAGTRCDTVLGVVRDALGILFLYGRTTSDDLPIAGSPAIGGPGGDGFLLKLDLSQPPDGQLLAARYLGLQLGTGSQGVADVYHSLFRLPNGLLALTGGAIGATFPLQNPLYDASSAPGFPRFLQLYSSDSFDAVFSTHLDAGGAATHAVAASQQRSRTSSPQNYLFAVTNTSEGGLSTPGRLQDQPAGGAELLIRRIEYADIANNFAPHVDLGGDIEIEAADADGADFDLSCIGCNIVDFDDLLRAYHWTVDGVRQTLTGPPFVGQITLPVGVHNLELAVEDTRGALGVDAFVITVDPPAANDPPVITVGADQAVTATSADGLLLYLIGTVRDANNDTLAVTWAAAGTTVQFEVFPPYFNANASALVRLPIGVHTATISASDNHGHIVTAQYTITVRGINTPAGAGVEVTPIDDSYQFTYEFTPGKLKLTFAGVATEGLTWFRTRTNQIPPPPAAPDPKQLGSAPFYYDVTTSATTSGDIRLCIDTTGMSFVDRSAIRLYRLNGTAWDDVTVPPTVDEAAARFICGVVPSSGPNIGTFAIFTPANESTRVTTIVGNGGPWVPGNPAPGDGGPASQAPISFPQNFVIDAPRQVAYVEDSLRIRRIDLQTNTISTFAGNAQGGISEPDGALASDIDVSANGIAVDRNGNVFIGGINGCSILRIDVTTRRVRRVAGLGPNPTTLECFYDGDGGRATAADINGAARMKFDADGNLFFIQTVFSSVLAGPGYAIRRVAAGADHLITGDDAAEIITTVAGGGTEWPPQDGDPRRALLDAHDIAFNAQGDLYVSGTAVIVRIAPAPGAAIVDGRPGEHLTVVAGHPILTYAPYQGDGGPALDANLNAPWGIDLLPNGDLLLADMMSSRIRMITAGPDGVVNGGPGEIISTVAGYSPQAADINTVPFGGDGYALSTNFYAPRDVEVDPRGGYNIVDTGFNRIRHVGLPLTTVTRADIEVVAEASSIDTGVNVPVTFHVLITNHGPATAINAGVEMLVPLNAQVVSATSPAGFCIIPLPGFGGRVFCEARTMAPGASVLMTIVLNPTGGDDLTATFTGGATEEDPVPGNNSSTASVRVVTPIDLGLSVTATPPRARVLEPFAYTVTVSNLSARPARVMRMNANLSPNLRFDGATPAGICSPLGNLITCDVDNFAGGSTLDITLNVTPLVEGTATSSFVVSNPDGDPNPANDSASIDVIVDNLLILVNEVIHVTDTPALIPAAMMMVSETIHVSDGPPALMTAVMIPVAETIHVNDAPRIVGPSVTILKEILDDRGLGYPAGEVDAGEVVRFRFRATNLPGSGPTTGPITITDVLDARFAYIVDASDQRCGNIGQTVTCTAAAPMTAGTSVDFVIHARIARDAAPPRQTVDVVNQAVVATAGDENPNDNSSSVTVTVRGVLPPSVFITKTVLDPRTYVEGELVTFRLTVTNKWSISGDRFQPPDFGTTFGAISVTDTLDPGFTFVAAGSDPACAAVGQTVGCISNDPILPGHLMWFDIVVRINPHAGPVGAVGPVPNTAAVSTPGDADASDNTAPVVNVQVRGQQAPDAGVFKRIVDSTLPCGSNCEEVGARNGDQITFRLRAELGFQAGPLTGPVTITDTLPAGLVPIQAFQSSFEPDQARFTCTIAGQQVTCALTDFGDWERHSIFVDVVARIGDHVAGFNQSVTLVNTASIATSDDRSAFNNTSSAQVIVVGPRQPDVEIFKNIVDASLPCNTTCAEVTSTNGSQVTFRLRAALGFQDGPLTGPVTITDTLPAGLVPIQAVQSSFEQNQARFTCTIAGQQVTCTLTDFANWDRHSIFVDIIARVADGTAGFNQTIPLVNTASIATSNDRNAFNNSSSATVRVQGPIVGAPTNVGANVIVRPTDANNVVQPLFVRFAGVTAPGVTAAIPIVPPPAAPAQFTFRGVVYDISTTATYVAPIEVCFDNGPFLPADLVWHAGVVLPPGAHTIRTPALLCAVVNSLSPFGVVTPIDTTAPSVAAPTAITVPATEAGGARGSAWVALAAFLAGGSATDAIDPAPVRLPPQAGGNIVDNNTLFPVGKTIVTFSFRDASGNVGTATSSVTVAVGTPRIAIQIARTGVVSGNRKFVDLVVTNTGNGNARQLTIDLIALIPLKGLGIPKLATPVPVVIGSLDAGSSTTVRIAIDVPAAVRRISITEVGKFRNVKGQLGAYLESQEFVVP